MEVTRDMIESQARLYLGVHWRHQGRTRENGLDCVGLPARVGADFGVWEMQHAAYPRRPDNTFVKYFKQYMDTAPLGEIDYGKVVLFAQRSNMCHCGIVTRFDDKGTRGLIHAYIGARQVIEEPLELAVQLLGRPYYLFTFPGVA